MFLTVGEDSYCTIEEANSFIRLLVLDESKDYWFSLDDGDRANLLKESTNQIECMPMQGIKYRVYQTLQFPRTANFTTINDLGIIPEDIKKCEAVNALAILMTRFNKPSDGVYLASKKAENLVRRWLQGGFKIGGRRT